jgi:malto-oligosyltrehalose trehalohydrolase
MPFGAAVTDDGVHFRLWAPAAARVDLEIDGGSQQRIAMQAMREGWFELTTRDARAGTRYRYRIDDELAIPDPASRFNPGDVHGPSMVVDPHAFAWHDADWAGRPWHEAVIYELHVGTFSRAGTFAGVRERLDYLVALGITTIELMPLADFPGARNWGYDGVLAFAPDARYGAPNELKSLIDAAHAHGLMVLLDVVYNHFGPEGNYLNREAPEFFTDRHHTPWGAAINFDGPGSRTVRDFFVHNALYWLTEYHADGLRLDAVHAIIDDSSPDFLSELSQSVRDGPGRSRHVHLVLENDRNEARRLDHAFTAQWNDDFHHVAHHLLTGETQGYYADYADEPLATLGRCLAEGFAYQGQASRFRQGKPRGEPSAQLRPDAFVNFLQNHDQIGNRAFGERMHTLASQSALRGALGVLLLAPSVPLLFMGEEFAAASPFLYFCDLSSELAAAVRDGRRAEFARFPGFDTQSVPDPGAPDTMTRSTLDWSSLANEAHASWLAFYRGLLALRAARIVPLIPRIVAGAAHFASSRRVLAVAWPLDDDRALRLEVRLPAGDKTMLPMNDTDVIWQYDDDAADAWAVRWSLTGAAK